MTELNPNFTIIVPGNCNAHCKFCYWNLEKSLDRGVYLRKLSEAIYKLPDGFRRVTITGGEPTLSTWLKKIVQVLRGRSWDAIVLTTNGTKLCDYLDVNVDHINISRHHYSDKLNWNIFDAGWGIPDKHELRSDIEALNKRSIDVTLNAVLCGQFPDGRNIIRYIEFARSIGASAVTFRADQNNNSTDKPAEMFYPEISQYTIKEGWSCPACKVWGQLICGMPVSWKAAVAEPSIKTNSDYELIFQPNGKITTDWAGAHSWSPKKVIGLAAKLNSKDWMGIPKQNACSSPPRQNACSAHGVSHGPKICSAPSVACGVSHGC